MQAPKKVPLTHRMTIRLPEAPTGDKRPVLSVLSGVMAHLHRINLSLPQGLAISFPDMRSEENEDGPTWGTTLIVFSDMQGLQAIMKDPRAGDYIRVRCYPGTARAVGVVSKWCRYKRAQEPGTISAAKFRRETKRMALDGPKGEAIRRGAFGQAVVKGYVKPGVFGENMLPTVLAKSGSNGHTFILSAKGETTDSPGNGLFGSFGLSAGGAVPMLASA